MAKVVEEPLHRMGRKQINGSPLEGCGVPGIVLHRIKVGQVSTGAVDEKQQDLAHVFDDRRQMGKGTALMINQPWKN